MDNRRIAAILDMIRDKNYDILTKDEIEALIEASNKLREINSEF